MPMNDPERFFLTGRRLIGTNNIDKPVEFGFPLAPAVTRVQAAGEIVIVFF